MHVSDIYCGNISTRPHRANDYFHQILVLAIILSVAAPCIFLVHEAPPTPPTRAAAQENPSFWSFIRALAGKEPKELATYMTIRQRTDFAIMWLIFGVLVAVCVSPQMYLASVL